MKSLAIGNKIPFIESDDTQTEFPTKDSFGHHHTNAANQLVVLSRRVYGEATHGERFGGVSMPGPVTGIYFVYHKLPEPQTPSRTCPRTQDIAAFRIRHSN